MFWQYVRNANAHMRIEMDMCRKLSEICVEQNNINA